MTEEKSEKKYWITEGILLALLPAVSYGVVFAFEAGYFVHFDLPLGLVEISIREIAVAFVSLLLTLYIFYVIAESINPFWVKIHQVLRSRLYVYILFFFMFFTHFVIARGDMEAVSMFLLCFVIVMAFFDFALPAIPWQGHEAYILRFVKVRNRDLEYDSVMDKMAFKIGFNWFILTISIIALLFLSYATGLGKARSQKEFYSLRAHSNSLILRMSDIKIVWMRYDPKTNKLGDHFTVELLEGGKELDMQKVKAGPFEKNESQ